MSYIVYQNRNDAKISNVTLPLAMLGMLGVFFLDKSQQLINNAHWTFDFMDALLICIL